MGKKESLQTTPRLVKEVPAGYKEEIRNGKKVFVLKSQRPIPKEPVPVKPKPTNYKPSGTPKKFPPPKPKPVEPDFINEEDVVYLEEPVITPTQKPQSLRTDMQEIFPSGLQKGYKSYMVPDLTGGGNYAKQKNVITDSAGMPVAYDFKENKYIQTGEPSIYKTMPVQNDTPTIQAPLKVNELPTKFDVVPERLRTPSYNAPKVTTPTVDTSIYKGFNEVGIPNTTNSNIEFQKEQEKNLAIPKLNKGGVLSKIKGYYDGGPVYNPNMNIDGTYGDSNSSYKPIDTFGSGVVGQNDPYAAQKAKDKQDEIDAAKKKDNQQKARNVANVIGEGIGGASSAYYNSQVPTSEGDAARNAGMAAVSQMGGIGGAIAGGNEYITKFAKPIKARKESMNAEGKLNNESDARTTAIGASFLSPSKALATRSSYAGGWTDVSGKGYTKSLEDKAQKQLQEVKDANTASKQQQAIAARNNQEENPTITNPYNLSGVTFDENQNMILADGQQFDKNRPMMNKGGIVGKIKNMYADGGKVKPTKEEIEMNKKWFDDYESAIAKVEMQGNLLGNQNNYNRSNIMMNYKMSDAPDYIKYSTENTAKLNDAIKFYESKYPQGYADGGEIKGKGTAKSDSIMAEVKEGSFVVPAENAELAKGIRKLYLKAPNKKANLKQEEGEEVKLSNGEHLFTPEENEYLESIGIDLEDLAPNSEGNNEEMRMGGMLKRADGSYSERGLWDNIRAAAGSGKAPTPEMLKQEKKIKDSYAGGGYVVQRSGDRDGKTHKVTGPDGTVKYFGDPNLGQHPKDLERKKAFYARHKDNLDNNPHFRAYARETWAEGGTVGTMNDRTDMGEYKDGGLTKSKAKIMLHEGMVNGKPITEQQRKYFGWVAGGSKQSKMDGGKIMAPKIKGYAAGGDVDGVDPIKELARLNKEKEDAEKSAKAESDAEKSARDKKIADFKAKVESYDRKADRKNKVSEWDKKRNDSKTKLDALNKSYEEASKSFEAANTPTAEQKAKGIKAGTLTESQRQYKESLLKKIQEAKSEFDNAERTYNYVKDDNNYDASGNIKVKPKTATVAPKTETKPTVVTENVPTTKPSLKAPKVTTSKVTVDNLPTKDLSLQGLKQDAELKTANQAAMQEASIANAPTRQAVINDANITSNENYLAAKPKSKNAWANKLSNIDPTAFVGIGQSALGLNMLGKEKRPIDKAVIDPTYNAAVNRAQQDALFGLTPEQRFMAEQDIQGGLNDAKMAGLNASGVQSFNLNRAAINDAWRNKLGLKQADSEMRMNKQKYADVMAADRATILAANRRQAYNDAMNTFQQKQQAGSELIGTGLANTIGAYRFRQDQQARLKADEARGYSLNNYNPTT